MKRFHLLIFACLFVNISFAQNSVKKHFVINTINPSFNIDKYVFAAENWGSIDEYRLYDKRRVIAFRDKGVTIELFSAKELLELYGKQIPPRTIMPNESYQDIFFDVTIDGKGLKPQLIKNN
ncbi:MAG: hypothetical protein M3Q58_02420 [Bacteroidota bacterium]|nr:hypothetical protein [Bacteroidota bacterium]